MLHLSANGKHVARDQLMGELLYLFTIPEHLSDSGMQCVKHNSQC